MDHIASIKAVVRKAREQGSDGHQEVVQQIAASLHNLASGFADQAAKAQTQQFARDLMRAEFVPPPEKNVASEVKGPSRTSDTGRSSATA